MSLSQASADAIILGIQKLQDEKNEISNDMDQKQAKIDALIIEREGLESKIKTINMNIDGINKDRDNMQSQADTIDKNIAIMTQDLADGGYKI